MSKLDTDSTPKNKDMKALHICFIALTISIISGCSNNERSTDFSSLEVSEVKVFSVGYPNITFQVAQTREDVLSNFQFSITDETVIKKILLELESIPSLEKPRPLESIVGIGEFYSGAKKNLSVVYDGYIVCVGRDLKVPSPELVTLMFEENIPPND